MIGLHKNQNQINASRRKAPETGVFRFDFSDGFVLTVLIGLLLLFVAYPIGCIFVRSFGIGAVGTAAEEGTGLLYYREVFQKYGRNLVNSLDVALWVSCLSTLMAVSAALFISTKKGFAYGLFMLILLITMVSPPFVSSLAYIQLYGKRGWITYGLFKIMRDPYNKYGVIWMESISYVPLNAMLLKGMLQKLDRSSLLSARDLGADPRHRVTDIVLPLMGPGIASVALLNFVRSLSDFGTPIIIGGRFSNLASEIYMQIVGYSSLEKASAMNVILFLPSFAAFLVYRRLMERSELLTGGSGHGTNASAQGQKLDLKLSGCGPIGILMEFLSWAFILMMVFQYGAIVFSAFFRPSRGIYHFTLEFWQELMLYNKSTMIRSIQYALVVSFAGSLASMAYAWYFQRRRIKGAPLWDFLATMPYMIPGSCFGIAYILAFNKPPLALTGTALIVIMNMIFKQLPTGSKIFSASFAQIPVELEKSARDLGASQLGVLKDVIIPSLRPAFLSSFTYNFSSAMTTAGSIIFLINPARKLAVFKLFDAVYKGEYGVASVISVIIIVVVLLFEAAAWLLLSDRRNHVLSAEKRI